MAHPLTIRPAAPTDAALILGFIVALAEYEKLLDVVTATEEDISHWLFSEQKVAEVVLAEVEGEAVGFALYFFNFSTFMGKPGIYLEDLFVNPEFRGGGIGKKLLNYLARIALERGFGRLEWSVLDWNTPSIAFYRSIGARAMDEWTVMRVEGEALESLASMNSSKD